MLTHLFPDKCLSFNITGWDVVVLSLYSNRECAFLLCNPDSACTGWASPVSRGCAILSSSHFHQTKLVSVWTHQGMFPFVARITEDGICYPEIVKDSLACDSCKWAHRAKRMKRYISVDYMSHWITQTFQVTSDITNLPCGQSHSHKTV